MPQTKVRWVIDKQFVGTDQNNQSVVMSGDSPPKGASPSQLLLIGLSACTAIDVLNIMTKKRKPLTYLEVVATGEQDPEPPWAYRKIHLKYHMAGSNLSDKAATQAIALSLEKYCSVAATIRGVADISTSLEMIDAPGPQAAPHPTVA